jgi:hypothetical protein
VTAHAQSTMIVSSSLRTLDVSNTLSSFVIPFRTSCRCIPGRARNITAKPGTARRQSSRKNSAPFQRECGESGVQATARGNAPRPLYPCNRSEIPGHLPGGFVPRPRFRRDCACDIGYQQSVSSQQLSLRPRHSLIWTAEHVLLSIALSPFASILGLAPSNRPGRGSAG